MKALLLGLMTEWDDALRLLMTYRKDIQVVALCDPFDVELSKQNDVVYTQEEAFRLYKDGMVDAIITTDESAWMWNRYLYQNGMERNYTIPTKYYRMKEIPQGYVEDIVRPYGKIRPELHQLEFQVADHCNLNCKACAHFSNLVKEPVFADKQQFEKDLNRLAELFDNIRSFFIMGGEPLLNPEVSDYCYRVREIFPYCELIIVTNGLLVPTMKEPLIRSIKETGTKISISNYSCLDEQKIIRFLEENGLSDIEIRNGKEEFTKNLNPRADGDVKDVFGKCSMRLCTFLGAGAVAACARPFTIHYFNDYFGESFAEGGAISLYEQGIDGFQILERLSVPMEVCRFCTYDEKIEWSTAKESAAMDDWCVV